MFAIERITELRRQIDALEAQWLALVAEYDRSGEWYESGFLTAASAIGHGCRMNRGQASGHVSLAREPAALPEVTEAFTGGDISRAHADVIVDAFTPERAAALAPLEPQLVNAARTCTSDHVRLRRHPRGDGRRLRGARRRARSRDGQPGAVGGARRPRPALRRSVLRRPARDMRGPPPPKMG
jgi:hypothetical protein